jgi:hypothetical protein
MNLPFVRALGVPLTLLSVLLAGTSCAASADVTVALKREGSLIIDGAGQYSFLIPTGWDLEQGSKPGDVKISKGTSPPYCWFLLIEASGLGGKEDFNMFKMAQKTVYKKFKIRKDSYRNVDGEWGGYLESRRTNNQGTPSYAWNLVSSHASVTCIVDCEASETEAEQVKPSVNQILDSFHWILKP